MQIEVGMANMNIQKKLIIPVMSAVILLLIVFSIAIVQYLRILTEKNITNMALDEIQIHAKSIQGFFEARARIPITFLQNPFFLDYFRNYRRFRQPLQDDPDYRCILQYFQTVLKNDSSIKSIFFAFNGTDEYFDEQGRFEQPGYSPRQRPWWKTAVQENRLYCGNPSFDIRDSTFSTTMQMPVYDRSRFLGIGGIDILITTVSNEINQIRYENQGLAFLIDGKGECLVFPHVKQNVWEFKKLDALDSLIQKTSGFSGLLRMVLKQERGHFPVMYDGRQHIALFTSVRSNIPSFDWRLGLLVPRRVIDAPIQRITVYSVGIVTLFILCVYFVMRYIAYSITKPLSELADRLDEMANRKSDLTIELPVESDDAIGCTAKNFNAFIRQIRGTLVRMLESMRTVSECTGHLQDHSGRIAAETQDLSNEAQRVSATSKLMAESMDEIAKGIKRVSQFSTQGKHSATEGEALMMNQAQRMDDMAKTTSNLYEEMERLKRRTESINSAVQLIRDINEQIALLSVNASIEAVRAGEHGSGFVVLAEEIKNLSERTDHANSQTWNTIKAFQQDIGAFDEKLLELKNRAEDELKLSEQLKQMFVMLQNDVSLTDQTTDEIKNNTLQQSESIRSIIETIHQISETIGHISKGVSQSFDEIRLVDEKVKELKLVTDVFKV